MKKHNYNITIEVEDGKQPNPVYLSLRNPDKHATTEEIVEGEVFADYDEKGNLIGVEMLESGEVTVKDRIYPLELSYCPTHPLKFDTG